MDILDFELERLHKINSDLRKTKEDEASLYAELDRHIEHSASIFSAHRKEFSQTNDALYWKKISQLYNLSPTFYKEAAEAMKKVVEQDPSAVEFWNLLGDLYCSLRDYDSAEKCYKSALEKKVNKEAYQNLSILCRIKGIKTKDDITNGISLAKSALTLDLNCPKSWGVLGNSYMAASLYSEKVEFFMKKALHAYKQAEKLGNDEDPSLFSNKFVALKFLEMYEEALQSIEPHLAKSGVDWRPLRVNYDELMQYLNDVQDLVNKKGKLRSKKRCDYLKQIKNATTGNVNSLKEVGVVVELFSPDRSLPYTVGLLNSADDVLVVTVFNMSSQAGFNIGDLLEVPAVNRTEVDFNISDKVFKFTKIRVSSPNEIVRNGKRVQSKWCQPFILESTDHSFL